MNLFKLNICKTTNIATLTLTNSQRTNPLSLHLMNNLISTIETKIENNENVRALIFKAEKCNNNNNTNTNWFSSGHDVNDLFDKKQNYSLYYDNDKDNKQYLKNVFHTCTLLNLKIHHLKQPTITIVDNQKCYSGGLQLIASTDIILATTNSEFSIPGSQRGRFCSTPSVSISNRIGYNKTLEYLLTGKKINAYEAYRVGLINYLCKEEEGNNNNNNSEDKEGSSSSVDDGDELLSIDDTLEQITNQLIHTSYNIELGKRGFIESSKYIGLDLNKQYELAEQNMIQIFCTKDASEGTKSMYEKRLPSWEEQ